MNRPEIDYDGLKNQVLHSTQRVSRGEDSGYTPTNAREDIRSLVYMGDDTRGVATKANTKGNVALGAAALAAGIGAYALFGDNGINDRISGFDSRLAAVERRTEPVLDIRTYLLDESCQRLGGQIAESNNDRQRNLTDCRFTQEQVGNNPYRFATSVISPEYRNNMLGIADRPDDRNWDAFNSRNLERLLDRGYAGIIAEQAPQRATSSAPQPQRQRAAAPSSTQTIRQESPQTCYELGRLNGYLISECDPDEQINTMATVANLDCSGNAIVRNADNRRVIARIGNSDIPFTFINTRNLMEQGYRNVEVTCEFTGRAMQPAGEADGRNGVTPAPDAPNGDVGRGTDGAADGQSGVGPN